MLFNDALKALLDGKYVMRNAWKQTGEYVILLPGMQYIWKILTKPNSNAGNWLPLIVDLMADDWEVVDNNCHEKVEYIVDAA